MNFQSISGCLRELPLEGLIRSSRRPVQLNRKASAVKKQKVEFVSTFLSKTQVQTPCSRDNGNPQPSFEIHQLPFQLYLDWLDARLHFKKR